MKIEQTLILVKPDGVSRGLVGEIISRIEAKGYVIADLKMMQADRALLERHYAEHQGKPFFEPLVEFMLSGPIVAIIAEGQRVIEGFRSLAGATDPTVAAPGTIRGDLARDQGTKVQQNLVHGSDSPESAAREIGLFFPGRIEIFPEIPDFAQFCDDRANRSKTKQHRLIELRCVYFSVRIVNFGIRFSFSRDLLLIC